MDLSSPSQDLPNRSKRIVTPPRRNDRPCKVKTYDTNDLSFSSPTKKDYEKRHFRSLTPVKESSKEVYDEWNTHHRKRVAGVASASSLHSTIIKVAGEPSRPTGRRKFDEKRQQDKTMLAWGKKPINSPSPRSQKYKANESSDVLLLSDDKLPSATTLKEAVQSSYLHEYNRYEFKNSRKPVGLADLQPPYDTDKALPVGVDNLLGISRRGRASSTNTNSTGISKDVSNPPAKALNPKINASTATNLSQSSPALPGGASGSGSSQGPKVVSGSTRRRAPSSSKATRSTSSGVSAGGGGSAANRSRSAGVPVANGRAVRGRPKQYDISPPWWTVDAKDAPPQAAGTGSRRRACTPRRNASPIC